MECLACHTPNVDGASFCAKCGAPLPKPAGPENDPLIGTIVGGRFRITGVLGEGGMGRVYSGEQQMGTSVRKVAIKTLLAQFAKDPETVARFMRECGTVAELEHPHTIKVYDFGQTPSGELYIAMELLTGKSLESILETEGALPPERVDRIMAQVCGSLQEAHDKGIIHRDLKPANVQLSVRAGEADYVKVLDFGIAKRGSGSTKQEQKLTQQGKILGTPPYMSPEQFKGGELDARSDIYSLGVMTYEMITHRLPFDADTPWAWATQHMTAQPFPFETVPMAANVPPKMRNAVMRALSKNPAQRQQTVREFYEELSLGEQRLSMLGGMRASGSSFASDPGVAPGGGLHTGPMAARSGQTQVGEPLFPGGAPQPVGRTMMEQAPVQASAGHVPTGGGQAFPAPPPAQPKKGGAGVLIGGAVVGALVLGGAAFLIFRPKGGPEVGSIGMPEAGTTAALSSEPPPTAGTASSTATAATTTVRPHPTGQPTSTGQASDPGSDAACQAAVNLARGNNIGPAVASYRKCKGPGQSAALSAIDAASVRVANAPDGCTRKGELSQASAIGASSGSSALQKKKCK